MEDTLETLRIVIQKVNQKKGFEPAELPSSLRDDYGVLASLLIFFRNSLLCECEPSRLLVLEELAVTAAGLGTFDKLRGLLARFDRVSFQRQCQSRRDPQSRFLSSTVFGIYPPNNIEGELKESRILGFDREHAPGSHLVGNRHWKRTREILEIFYTKAASGYQRKCLEILLCKSELAQTPQMKDPWYRLWVLLYSWTLSCFLKEEGPSSDSVKTQLGIAEEHLNEKQCPLHLTIFYIMQLIIHTFLLQVTDKDHFLNCIQHCSSSFNPDYLMEEAILTVLIKDCFNLAHLPAGLSFANERLSRIQEQVPLQSNFSRDSRNVLLSYLMPENQLLPFLKSQKMPFWKYCLTVPQKEQFARAYLQEQLPEASWQEVLGQLSGKDLNQLLARPKDWIDKPWKFVFLETLADPSEYLLERMEKANPRLPMDQLISSMSCFSQQWNLYFCLQSNQSSPQTIELLQQVLSFDSDSCAGFAKIAQFPLDQSQFFVDCSLKYVNLLQLADLGLDVKAGTDFMKSGSYVRNLNRFTGGSSGKWGLYWSKWIDLLSSHSPFMKGLSSIEPEEPFSDDDQPGYF